MAGESVASYRTSDRAALRVAQGPLLSRALRGVVLNSTDRITPGCTCRHRANIFHMQPVVNGCSVWVNSAPGPVARRRGLFGAVHDGLTGRVVPQVSRNR